MAFGLEVQRKHGLPLRAHFTLNWPAARANLSLRGIAARELEWQSFRMSDGLVFKRRQSPQHFRSARSMGDRLVFANLAVAENQHALGVLRDVVLVGYQHNGHSLVIQVLKNLHDFDRRAAVKIS